MEKIATKRRRDVTIDLLRFIALTCIIIAHINPSPLLFQLRNFDVPLMVFLSGVSFRISSGNNNGYWHYAFKRFKRLILPVWAFLLVYDFIILVKDGEMLPLTDMVRYGTMMTPWFVWIIRVFFVIAMIAPLISGAIINCSKKVFLLWSVVVLVAFEALCMTEFSQFPFSEYVLMNIPYLIVFALGLKIMDFKAKEVAGILTVSCSVFICLLLGQKIGGGNFLPTQLFKYPPRIYYLSYAISATLLLWILKDRLVFMINKISPKVLGYIANIGSHTIWIYLWHIVVLAFVGDIDYTIVRFLVVYGAAIGITYLQVKIVEKITENISNTSLKKNIRMVFIG